MSHFFIEIRDLTTRELVDRNPVCSSEHEDAVFRAEVERCELLRARDPGDWDPIVITLLWGDIPVDAKELPILSKQEIA